MPLQPTYTVVIPAYNAEKFIGACLDSIITQTLPPIEIIIVDDKSKDNTIKVIQSFEKKISQKEINLILYCFEQNKGPSAARNKAISMAKGDFIAFLDADDIWHSEKLHIVDHFIRKSNALFFFHSYSEKLDYSAEVNLDSYRSDKLDLHTMLLRNPAATPCTVISNHFNIVFNQNMHYCEDYDLWLRISEHTPIIKIIGPPLTQLGRPPLSHGGLSGNRLKMRTGEIIVYYNFCSRNWPYRFWLFPCLLLLSFLKHIYSYTLSKANFTNHTSFKP